MPALTDKLKALHARILETAGDERLRLHPQLDRLIERMDEKGESVPAHIRSLNDELADEAIEAQFDNMPV